MNQILELPIINSPVVFGLHPNAEITYYTNAAKSIWDDLLLLQATGGNISGGFDKD
jgi:dynein heavy chain